MRAELLHFRPEFYFFFIANIQTKRLLYMNSEMREKWCELFLCSDSHPLTRNVYKSSKFITILLPFLSVFSAVHNIYIISDNSVVFYLFWLAFQSPKHINKISIYSPLCGSIKLSIVSTKWCPERKLIHQIVRVDLISDLIF